MKRVIWGIIRRLWWLYAAAPVLSAACGVLIPWQEAHDALRGMATGPKDPEIIRDIVAVAPFIPLLLAAMTGFAAVGDLVVAAGVLNLLPVSARRIGSSYWLMAAVLPPVMTGLILGGGAALWGHFGPPGAPGAGAVMADVLSSLFSAGFLFFAFALHAQVLTSAGNQGGKVHPTLNRFFPQSGSVLPTAFRIIGSAALILVSLSSPVILPVWLHSGHTHPGALTALALLGAAVTVAGGWRAETMLRVWSRKRFREIDLSSRQSERAVKPESSPSPRRNILTSVLVAVLVIALLLGLSGWIFGFPRSRRDLLLSALTCFALALNDALARYLRPKKYSDYLHPVRLAKYWARDRSAEPEASPMPGKADPGMKPKSTGLVRVLFADDPEMPLYLAGMLLILGLTHAIFAFPRGWAILLVIMVGSLASSQLSHAPAQTESAPGPSADEEPYLGKTLSGKPLPLPGRFGSLNILLDCLWVAMVMLVLILALDGISALVHQIFGPPKSSGGSVVPFYFFRLGLLMCAVAPSMRHAGSVRLLRSLPVSGPKLVAMLYFQPLVNMTVFLAFSGLTWSLGFTGGMVPPPVAVLLYLAGTGVFLNALGLRLGWDPQLLLLAFILAANPYSFLQTVPPILLWTTGLVLLVTAYGLILGSIRSSGMYGFRKA